MKGMAVDLKPRATKVVKRLGTITGRQNNAVMSDMMRSYLWIIYEQTCGKKVVSMNGNGVEKRMENLVMNRRAALRYFREIGWITPSQKRGQTTPCSP